jgi:PAS domain S-box-containing protein
MHRLLERQIKRTFGKDFQPDTSLQPFLQVIDDYYQEIEKEQKLLQNALRINTEELNAVNEQIRSHNAELTRTMLNTLSDGVYATDMEGKLTFMNAAAESILGMREQDLMGRNVHESIHHHHPDGTIFPVENCPLLKVRQTGVPVEGHDHFINQQGSYIPVEYRSRPILQGNNTVGALVSFNDISEKLESETKIQNQQIALQESAQYTQSILDNALDCIITFDETGIIKTVNRAVKNIFGYAQQELIGLNITFLMPDIFSKDHVHYTDKGTMLMLGDRRETDGQHKDGHHLPVHLAASQTTHQGQSLFVGIVRDISEQKRVDKMKTEFVSTVSHELRTPLTAISGALWLIVGVALGQVQPPMQIMLDIAHKNSLRLSLLINDLLDMEKLVAGKMVLDFSVQALMPLIEQSIESNNAYGAQYKVSYKLTERCDDVQVNVDALRLQQVMANFLSNAAKFSPSGENVQISVSVKEKIVRVAVIDHGPGIPLEFHNRIFQKFAQADSSDTRQKGGTGLGLAISKEYILRMHGQIDFTSKIGVGTCFYFELPLWEEAFPLGE